MQNSSTDDARVTDLLSTALQARTENVYGAPDSLSRLRAELQRPDTAPRRAPRRRSVEREPRRALKPLLSGLAVVIAIAAVIAGINLARPDSTKGLANRPATLSTTGSNYRPGAYYPAITATGQPVIVRASDDKPVRLLPSAKRAEGYDDALWSMVLSPDGTRVYGVYEQVGADGEGLPFSVAAQHVAYIDLATNRIITVASRDGVITGMSLSADGSTIAYALAASPELPRNRYAVYVHNLRNDSDRHFLLAPGQTPVPMALSPDGSRLAFRSNADASSVWLVSTTTGASVPGPLRLPNGDCGNPSYRNVQWTRSGLYAVQICAPDGGTITVGLARYDSSDVSQPPVKVAGWPLEPNNTAIVREGDQGPVLYVNAPGGTGYRLRVIDLATHRFHIASGLGLSTFVIG